MRYVLTMVGLLVVCGALFVFRQRVKERGAEELLTSNTAAVSDDSSPFGGVAGITPQALASPNLTNEDMASTDEEWLEQVELIRSLAESDVEKSVRLLALFPSLPVEGQNEIAPELAALTPDEAYDALGRLLTNTNSSEEVLMVLFTDLLDRPDSTRLPLLLDLAKNSNHAQARDAHEMLTVELGDDCGTDWDLWAKKISERLASRPE